MENLDKIVNSYYFNGTVDPEKEVLLGEISTLDLIPEDKSLIGIDIGCGPGVLTEKLADKIGYVLGVDFLPFMIDHAKKNHSRPNIDYVTQDFLSIDYPENNYDVVFSTNCFIHIQDKKTLLTKIYNILKRGGLFVFCDVTQRDGIVKRSEGNYTVSVQDYIEMLNSAGFTNVTYIGEKNRILDGEYSGNLYATFKCSK